MKSNTEYKTNKKLKKELKTLKRAIKIMFVSYVISIIIILFTIKHYLPDHQKNGKKIIANMITGELLKDSKYKNYLK
tara:strand:+ start:1183 stop:1413 length:231 start_codon:yes stop_codon:yes gene_type:complete